MNEISRRQRHCLEFIGKSIAERGWAPTLREIGEEMGIRSTNGVSDHLRGLERKGYISKPAEPFSRAIRLTAMGRAELGWPPEEGQPPAETFACPACHAIMIKVLDLKSLRGVHIREAIDAAVTESEG